MTNLEDIEGVAAGYAEKLRAAGVGSVEALLEKGGTAKGREEIATASGIGDAHVLKWVNHADLFRIHGVGGEYAELLEAAGVDSVAELAQRNATNLGARLTEINDAKHLVRSVPALTQVEKWIAEAKELPRAVSH